MLQKDLWKFVILMLIRQFSQNQLKQKTNSKYLIGYSDKITRPLALMMPKMSAYFKIF